MAQRTPIGSPCTGVCELDPHTGYCRGCFRTGDEIMAWPMADNARKREILRQLKPRRTSHGGRTRAPRMERQRVSAQG
jgi:hypothetical protein